MIGRFAPSPTGPLHFGSLVTAVASYLDARANDGQWFVRMEDVDTPRVMPGADADILRTLEAFGFEWDGPVVYQSTRNGAYRAAFDELYRGVDAIICHSEAVRARRAMEFGVLAEKVSVIQHGPFFYDLPASNREENLRSFALEQGKVQVLWLLRQYIG